MAVVAQEESMFVMYMSQFSSLLIPTNIFFYCKKIQLLFTIDSSFHESIFHAAYPFFVLEKVYWEYVQNF